MSQEYLSAFVVSQTFALTLLKPGLKLILCLKLRAGCGQGNVCSGLIIKIVFIFLVGKWIIKNTVKEGKPYALIYKGSYGLLILQRNVATPYLLTTNAIRLIIGCCWCVFSYLLSFAVLMLLRLFWLYDIWGLISPVLVCPSLLIATICYY